MNETNESAGQREGLDPRSLLADRLGEVLLLLDAQGRVREANRAFLSLGNWRLEDVQGVEIIKLLPDLPPRSAALARRALRTGSPQSFVYQYSEERREGEEKRMGGARLREDEKKEEREFEVRLYPSEEDALVVLALDESRAVEEIRRRRAEKRAVEERFNSVKRDFFSTMSHELRTPLTAILGYAEILEGDAGSAEINPERRGDYLRRIILHARRLLDLVNDVLDLASLEKGGVSLSLEPVALIPLIHLALEDVRGEAKEKGQTILVDCPDGEISCQADARRVQQIIGGMLHNAIKFTPPGGEVLVKCQVGGSWNPVEGEAGECAQITVSDNGPGVSPELRRQIFRPFEPGDASAEREHEGIGLSLALGRSFARLMGGDLYLEEECDAPECKGASFSLRLPVANAPLRWRVFKKLLGEALHSRPGEPERENEAGEK